MMRGKLAAERGDLNTHTQSHVFGLIVETFFGMMRGKLGAEIGKFNTCTHIHILPLIVEASS